MNKSVINKTREIPFLEDFSIETINTYLNIFLIISKKYCQIPFYYDTIEGIINQIREGQYPGLSYSTKIMELLSYNDFKKLFENYLKENNLKDLSFHNCGIIINKLLLNLKKINSGDKIEDSILSIIQNLKTITEIQNLIVFTKNDVDKTLGLIFPKKSKIDGKKKLGKNKQEYRYKREVNKRVFIYIEEENRLESFELIKRIGNITILKNKKGEYFLREYLIKPLIKVDLVKGISLKQNQNGKESTITIKIEIKNGLEEIIMKLEE